MEKHNMEKNLIRENVTEKEKMAEENLTNNRTIPKKSETHVQGLSVKQMQDIYEKYMVKDFPQDELKPWKAIVRMLEKDQYKAYGYFEKGECMAYAFLVKSEEIPCVLLDYFAVLEHCRKSGIGSRFLLELKEILEETIILEAEDAAFSKDEEDRIIRERRCEFYKKNGMLLQKVKTKVMGVPYVIYISKETEAYEQLRKIYGIMFGENNMEEAENYIEVKESAVDGRKAEKEKIVDRDKAQKAFEAYIGAYDLEDGKIKLKVDHTYRVAALSERIAKSLDLTEEEVDLAWLIGLLHDIGRFEQIKDYGTFDDSVSVDHAKYGVKLLFEKDKIKEFIDQRQYDEWIKTAIDQHNVFRMKSGMSDKMQLFCKIIRDADKIDILKVNIDTPIEVIYNTTEEQLKKDTVSDEVLREFYNKTAVLHKYKKTALDRYFGHISLVFELEFPISYEIVKEQGYLDQILSFRNDVAETNERFEAASRFMKAFLEEKIQK